MINALRMPKVDRIPKPIYFNVEEGSYTIYSTF